MCEIYAATLGSLFAPGVPAQLLGNGNTSMRSHLRLDLAFRCAQFVACGCPSGSKGSSEFPSSPGTTSNPASNRGTFGPARFALIILVILLGCGGSLTEDSGSAGSQPPPSQEQYTIQISPSNASVVVGATLTLVATARNSAGTLVSTPIQWSSSNTAVATVDAQGIVAGRAAGTSTIMAAALGATTSTIITVTLPVVTLRGTGTVYVGGKRTPFPGGPLNDEILAIDAQTLIEKNLTLSQGTESNPLVSPDGQYLVYSQLVVGTTNTPVIAKRDGTRIIELGTEDCGGGICTRNWRWLNDGRFEYTFEDPFSPSIRTYTPGSGVRSRAAWPQALFGVETLLTPNGSFTIGVAGNGALTSVTLLDGKAVSIAPACRFSTTCGDVWTWSPSATTLFTARDGALVAVSVDGSSLRTLYSATSGSLTEAAASPDGTMLAFVEDGRLKILRVADNSVSSLANVDGQLAWSPDSRSIAYASRNFAVAINVDGTGSRVLATLPEFTSPKGISWGK